MEKTDLADMRRDYSSRELSESSIDADPFVQFGVWFDEAIASGSGDANAMTLATAGANGQPSSRIELLKGVDHDGFVFFTNYESRKGRELTSNPFASLTFFWPQLERQVNVAGMVSKTSVAESEAYFRSRPFGSRIAAAASIQSSRVSSRNELLKAVNELNDKYADGDVPLPPFWGGFRLVPDRIEFWQGRVSRLHDRICYEREGENWQISRLSP